MVSSEQSARTLFLSAINSFGAGRPRRGAARAWNNNEFGGRKRESLAVTQMCLRKRNGRICASGERWVAELRKLPKFISNQKCLRRGVCPGGQRAPCRCPALARLWDGLNCADLFVAS